MLTYCNANPYFNLKLNNKDDRNLRCDHFHYHAQPYPIDLFQQIFQQTRRKQWLLKVILVLFSESKQHGRIKEKCGASRMATPVCILQKIPKLKLNACCVLLGRPEASSPGKRGDSQIFEMPSPVHYQFFIAKLTGLKLNILQVSSKMFKDTSPARAI